jgi:uncharacterized YccA/Bax inhibitor family protein
VNYLAVRVSRETLLRGRDPKDSRLGVVAATGGIAVFCLITFVLGFFGVRFNSVYGSGLIGIGFSVSGRSRVEPGPRLRPDRCGARTGAPKYMEWYGAFALM